MSYESGLRSSRWIQHTQWVCIDSWGIQCFYNKSKLALWSRRRHCFISEGCLIQTQLKRNGLCKKWSGPCILLIHLARHGNVRDPMKSVSSNSSVPSLFEKELLSVCHLTWTKRGAGGCSCLECELSMNYCNFSVVFHMVLWFNSMSFRFLW